MSQNLITLDISSIDFNSPKFKMVGGLTLDKVKIKYNWIFNASIKDAIIGEDKNGLVWFSGTWLNGTWENGTWYSGEFQKGRWKNGNVYSYDIDFKQSLDGKLHIYRVDISKTHFINCTFEGGNFNYGIFGNIKNISKLTLPYEIDKEYVINNIEDYKIDTGLNTGLNTGTTINIGFDTYIDNNVKTIETDSNGDILVGGKFTTYNNYPSTNIIKLHDDGTVDTSFFNKTKFNGQVNIIKVDTYGKILVGGEFTTYNNISANKIIRLNSDGTIDTSFTFGIGFNNTVNTIEIESGNTILIGGKFISYNGITTNNIVRLNYDGSIQSTFSNGFNGYVNIIKIDTNNKILVGGEFLFYNSTNCKNIIRLNPDNSVDTTFNYGTGFNNKVNTIEIDEYKKILIGGNFTSYSDNTYNRIIKLNIDGSIDTGFNIGLGFDNIVNCIKIDSNSNIIVSGDFNSYNRITNPKLVRLSSNGNFDVNFINEKYNNKINTISISSFNKILVGGNFTQNHNIYQHYLIRLNNNGDVNKDNGMYYDNTLKTAIFSGGTFVNGLFNSAYFNDGNFQNGIMNNCIWKGGSFYNGYYLDGEWYNGNFYGGSFSNGNWHNGTFYTINNSNTPMFGLNYKNKKSSATNWYNGDFSNGQVHSGINTINGVISPSVDNTLVNWYNGSFNNGEWYGGTFNHGIWNNGIFNSGIINDITFNNGQILDTICNGGTFNSGGISGGLFVNAIFGDTETSGGINLGYEIY